MSSDYDRKELKIVRRGISTQKVIAAYKHFGSLRQAGKYCGIDKGTVAEVLKRAGISQVRKPSISDKVAYNPKKAYSTFALWLKKNRDQVPELAVYGGLKEIAHMAGVSIDTVKCYFYRRRKQAAKILHGLPDLKSLKLVLEDIEGYSFTTDELLSYKYIIDRYSERAALQGTLENEGDEVEITALIPSIELFANRVRELISTSGR